MSYITLVHLIDYGLKVHRLKCSWQKPVESAVNIIENGKLKVQ